MLRPAIDADLYSVLAMCVLGAAASSAGELDVSAGQEKVAWLSSDGAYPVLQHLVLAGAGAAIVVIGLLRATGSGRQSRSSARGRAGTTARGRSRWRLQCRREGRSFGRECSANHSTTWAVEDREDVCSLGRARAARRLSSHPVARSDTLTAPGNAPTATTPAPCHGDPPRLLQRDNKAIVSTRSRLLVPSSLRLRPCFTVRSLTPARVAPSAQSDGNNLPGGGLRSCSSNKPQRISGSGQDLPPGSSQPCRI